MNVTETIVRECCSAKDLKPVEGCVKYGMNPEFKFCVHCGARHEYHRFTDPAGGTDSEYRKVAERVAKSIIAALVCLFLSVPVLAQVTVTTGPVSLTNKLAWSMADGATATAAAAFEARVHVDGGAQIVVPAVTCAQATILDTPGATWTLGTGTAPNIMILRNGMQAGGAFGVKLALYLGVLYAQANDTLWYKWNGTGFVLTTAADPSILLIDAAATSRWNCLAPLTAELVRVLNAPGTHSLVLRLYDAGSMKESVDSVPLAWVTPVVITQPIRVTIR